MVRTTAAGYVSLPDLDERAVFRSASAATWYRRKAPGVTHWPDHPRGAGRLAAASQALPMVLLEPPRRGSNASLPARRSRFPARLFPPQERRLEGKSPPSASLMDRRRTGKNAHVLHHGPG